MIRVYDDVLTDPFAYRNEALERSFARHEGFDGVCPLRDGELWDSMHRYSQKRPVLSFFRRSPEGQSEPNFIHSDAAMGKETAIYYMTPNPPEPDGTSFWDLAGIGVSGAWSDEAKVAKGTEWRHVPARFNRLLVFDADYFHSRAIPENYGQGNDARLIQVVFLA